jgi:hypothetical protein
MGGNLQLNSAKIQVALNYPVTLHKDDLIGTPNKKRSRFKKFTALRDFLEKAHSLPLEARKNRGLLASPFFKPFLSLVFLVLFS